jgi:hypothetical protein
MSKQCFHQLKAFESRINIYIYNSFKNSYRTPGGIIGNLKLGRSIGTLTLGGSIGNLKLGRSIGTLTLGGSIGNLTRADA